MMAMRSCRTSDAVGSVLMSFKAIHGHSTTSSSRCDKGSNASPGAGMGKEWDRCRAGTCVEGFGMALSA